MIEPCCPECLSYVQPRLDGLLPNHRDQDGQPCPGSRREPNLIERKKVKAPKLTEGWNWR